jgi:sirohydrochlorin ferrochelatase
VAEFLGLVEQIRPLMGDTLVEPSFLELAQPSIAEGLQRLVGQGVGEAVVLPLLLFAAGHVRKDIPMAVAQATKPYPGLRVQQVSHLGCNPRIVELSQRRYDEILAGRPPVSPEQTLLLLVGRGSRDRRATEEMLQFASLRRETTSVGHIETCFAAMERPSLAEMLPRVAEWPLRRIVVQPHLLFPGYLAAKIRAAVEQQQAQWPAIDWLVTEPLGADRLLAEVVMEIATEAVEPRNVQRRRPG